MIVRKIKPEELKRTAELFSIAFEFDMDNSKSADQFYQEASQNLQSREDYYWQERWAAFEDDNKTMMSFFVAKPFPVHFDGHSCKMIGIGGVSTLPQYRRLGGIRACFEAALPDMYANDAVFSYLYPFSTAYYRKFGYEMCVEKMRYQIKISAIRPFIVDGRCHLVEQGNFMLEDIKKIYRVWQNRYNLMVENEDFEYDWVLKSNPPKDQHFTYIYKSKEGEPKGYLTFTKEDTSTGRNMLLKRLIYTDVEGFKGLMNLVHSCASDHEFVTFYLPIDQNIVPLFPEWSLGAGKCGIVFGGMVRVINAQKALQLASYQGDGSLVIQIADPIIPQNNGSFYVRYEHGAAVEVKATDMQVDIELGINDFSRLIVGVIDMNSLPFLEEVRVNTDIDKLSKVFHLKPNYITESF